MKTFVRNKKQSTSGLRKARPHVLHPIGPVQQAQQAALRRLLRFDEVQAMSEIDGSDSKLRLPARHVAANRPIPAVSDMSPSGAGSAIPIQRSENEAPEVVLQRQYGAAEKTVKGRLIQRQGADMHGIRPSRFGYRGPEAKAQQAQIDRILHSTDAQAKLTVGQPNDNFERELDRVADQVTRAGDAEVAQRHPVAGQEEDPLQPKQGHIAKVDGHKNPHEKVDAIKGGGQPLPPSERSFFEPLFGHDFRPVRVHSDTRADVAAASVNAKAFTRGNDIVFASGQYAPGKNRGRKLLAHELTHVVQQKRVIDRPVASSDVLQRKLTYHRQIPDAEAEKKGYLKDTDDAIAAIDSRFKKPASSLKPSKRLKAVLAKLLDFKKKRKITHWETSGADAPASFDPSTGEMRIHYYAETSSDPGGRIKRGRSLKTVLIHEAAHALHAAEYPRTTKAYAKALAAGFAEGSKGLELIKFKAFTEYWAYRRQWEFYNLRQDPEFHVDPHKRAIQEKDVKRSIKRIKKETGLAFDPSTWKPKEKRKK